MKFTIIETADGSPSINFIQSEILAETMHNKNGAYAETLYIYYEALQLLNSYKWPHSILSIGLGLAYNEMITIAHWLTGPRDCDLYIESFESEQELVSHFLDWLNDSSNLSPEWKMTYNKILQLIANTFLINSTDLKLEVKKVYAKKNWIIREALDAQTQFKNLFSCVLYDAYSSKTSPLLWDESFLISFIKKSCLQKSILTTYAAKGTLNRALKENSFKIYHREGYGGKRESTLAIRGAIIDYPSNRT